MRSEQAGTTRASPRWPIIGGVVLLLTAGFFAYHSPSGATQSESAAVTWRDPEAESAGDGGKARLYYFSADWCAPCKLMDREVFAEPSLAAAITREFVTIKVTDRRTEDGTNRPLVQTLEDRFGVVSFPTLVVVSRSGTVSKHSGYTGAAAVAAFLEEASGVRLEVGARPRSFRLKFEL